ncbi:ribosome maturation factor RimP [Aquihabitans sp. McL0605]|uniref:ribosome maturation factor RimP n=1 Tax=Aquihabitans sp. McL0605 TaxID=3415671 RepID=UPI003CF77890
MDTTTRVRLLIEPLVEAAEVSIYDFEYAGGVLRLTVDRPGGVDIGVIGKLTRDISRMLDEEDPMPGQYTLEVSSPGLERALRTPEHFAGAVGTLVSIKTRAGVEGDRRFKGVVTAADDDTATIAVTGGDPAAPRTIALADIERARTIFEWGPAPKPGAGSKPGAAPKSSPSSKKKAAKS